MLSGVGKGGGRGGCVFLPFGRAVALSGTPRAFLLLYLVMSGRAGCAVGVVRFACVCEATKYYTAVVCAVSLAH